MQAIAFWPSFPWIWLDF